MTTPAVDLGVPIEAYLEWEEAWSAAQDGSPFCPPPNIYFGVPFETYRAWEAENQSSLKPLAKSPGHYRDAMDYPKDSTKAMDIGSALDVAWLESPELAAEMFSTPPIPLPLKANGKPYSNWLVSNSGKAWLSDMAEAGITVLSIADVFKVYGMLLALEADEEVMELRRGARTQVSLVWICPVTGLLCKARFDLLGGMDGPLPWKPSDLKTTNVEIDPYNYRDPFMAQAGKMDYDRQAAYYCWGLTVLTGVEHLKFPIIGVEQNRPHPVAIYDVPELDIVVKQGEIIDLLELLVDCRASGKWPASQKPPAGQKYHTLTIPKWARS